MAHREFRRDLRRLIVEVPDALTGFVDPDGAWPAGERPSLGLAAWAVDIAADLHAKYGDEVELEVGAMPYPNEGFRPDPHLVQRHGAPAAEGGLSVELVTPLEILSGYSATVSTLVANDGSTEHTLSTNGHLQCAVVDQDREVVGRYTGPQRLPMVRFRVEPGQHTEVPVLVGTDSLDPALGYAVPPGKWAIVVELPTSDGLLLSTPLPITVTP
jgi:hypothetical protein